VRLAYQHVDERRLAVVQVADDGDVADQVRVLHHTDEELLRVHVRGLLLLDDVEVLGLDGRHHALRDRHRVLVLHGRLHVLAIHLHGGGIILLVLVQHNARLIVAVTTSVLQQSIPSYASLVFHPLLLIARLIVTVLDLRRITVFIAVDLWPDVVSKLIVQVLLNVHARAPQRRTSRRSPFATTQGRVKTRGLKCEIDR